MILRQDDLGREIRIPGPARQIVSLVPSITETLFALGAEDRIVGITDYCIHPRDGIAEKTKIGGTKNVNVEAVLALRPDLVIANVEENREHLVRRLELSGIPVFVTFPKNVDGCCKMIRDVAALTAAERQGATILSEIEAARRDASAGIRKIRVLCPIWKNPYMTINRDTFVHSILEEAGGENVFADAPERYPRFELKDAARLQPRVIILPTEPYHFGESDKAEFESLDIPASHDGRIHIVEGELLSWYGPRVARALRLLSGIFAQV
jgi:ABC-type Fe3+-hydroxamate transport system substrate-binding protein